MKFISMTDAEFKNYKEAEITGYAKELSRYFDKTEVEALKMAEKSFENLLNKKNTKNYIYKIFDERVEGFVGDVWFSISGEEGKKVLFIGSIKIYEEHRGKGFGRGTMNLVEEFGRNEGVKKMALHVFGQNERAKALYTSIGYKPISINMEKKLI